jgi:hypothetical protein
MYTTDLLELAGICERLFPTYVAPLLRDRTVPVASLWNRIANDLAAAVRTLYTRELRTTSQSEIVSSAAREAHEIDAELAPSRNGATSRNLDARLRPTVETMDLSRSSKFLLVAAFLAASNPPKLDLHYFSTQQVRRRKKVRRDAAKVNASIAKGSRKWSLSSASLPLNRIIAIFDSIQGVGAEMSTASGSTETSRMSTAAFVNLSSLVTLQLLGRDATGDLISDPKFRCNIDIETASEVADSLGLALREYLHVDMREE